MKKTKHFTQRTNQRGITKEMVELVEQFGKQKKDKLILGKKEIVPILSCIKEIIGLFENSSIRSLKNKKIEKYLPEIKSSLSKFQSSAQIHHKLKELYTKKSNLLKILDKGGLVLVQSEGCKITAYTKKSYNRKLIPSF